MRLISIYQNNKMQAGAVMSAPSGDKALNLAAAARSLGMRQMPDTIRGVLEAGEPALSTAAAIVARAEKIERRIAAGRERRPVWMSPLGKVRLGPPVPDPEKIICIGQNYLDHIKEQEELFKKTIPIPENPVIFAKFPSALAGPYDPIPLPPARVTSQVDYESELAVVIGKTLKRVTQREATEGIAGYMVMNDVSARDCQFADRQWVRGKTMDGFAPCGPWLTTPGEVANPHKLAIWARLNGETMQDSNTKQMIFKIPRIIAYLSQCITFRPGDVITTGTPPGVGAFREPQVFLKAGDMIECGVEGLGELRNPVERG